MTKMKLVVRSLGAAALVATSGAAMAETLSVPATVTVDNTIDFQLTGSLDFGTLRGAADNTGTTCVGVTMPANPASALTTTLGTAAGTACTTGAGNAVLATVGGTPARPEFAVAGLAAFATLDVTVPVTTDETDGIEMALATPPPGAPVFQLHDFTVYQSSGTPGTVALTAGVGTLNANGTGDIVFNVGATIITDPGTPTATEYQNAAYTANFDVEVAY